ncbi:hypothetical protein L332_03410 [Agrococcus pavilionensis RW1]|uniref:Uncharacterized protein n=1 Tax=Agrococcus pavilionensis RW1 TaxID=1330458 RepID=U1L946_9MICO|nr:hypothetical protein L332_03410 [Agrococcus pavilionensis RW1]
MIVSSGWATIVALAAALFAVIAIVNVAAGLAGWAALAGFGTGACTVGAGVLVAMDDR